jgi:glycosyltransferase involved in cell wall biosynthesis
MAHMMESIRKVALLGNHLPRQCGIATFTTDLAEAIGGLEQRIECAVVAVNDAGRTHQYPPRVQFEISEPDLVSYRRAADFLNVSGVDVVGLQHEYGIFGGKGGSHVLALVRDLRMPVVSTLHTILTEPNDRQRHVMDELVDLSTRLVVMSEQGSRTLQEIHRVPLEKIDVIPHGIPALPYRERKNQLGVAGKHVILTFGLLSPDKGIEYVIDALPEILARHPETVYIVLGATHPHVKERDGESYRVMLASRAARLGVEGSVIFHDRFVTNQELADFLCAADIYVTPYLNMQQSTSGTLAYAVGGGRAVISTPYRHAVELLADGRGILVPRADSTAIASEVIELLSNDEKRATIGRQAAMYGADKLWPTVGRRYVQAFERARAEHRTERRRKHSARTLQAPAAELPDVNLEHLGVLTDCTGVLQHATHNVPSYAEGYCVDDNARALLLMALAEDAGTDSPKLVRSLATRYLAFVNHAYDPTSRRFRNFMTYTRQWVAAPLSDDCHGRAIWALGTVVGRSEDPGRQSLAGTLFKKSLPVIVELTSPRAWAYTLLGIAEYLRAFRGDSFASAVQTTLATRLHELFRRSSFHDWPWFEDRLTYCNARLPQALIVTSEWTKDPSMRDTGLDALEWLAQLQTTKEGYFAPIGSDGFYVRGLERARFDQQPVEAASFVSACLDARRITGDGRWYAMARRGFDWFLGHNQLQKPLYQASTGACHDGLHVDRINANQGAESTLSFLLALFEMRSAERGGALRHPVGALVA